MNDRRVLLRVGNYNERLQGWEFRRFGFYLQEEPGLVVLLDIISHTAVQLKGMISHIPHQVGEIWH